METKELIKSQRHYVRAWRWHIKNATKLGDEFMNKYLENCCNEYSKHSSRLREMMKYRDRHSISRAYSGIDG